jgi:hypothetical protein
LLTAVAVAIDAAFKSYQINQEQSLLTQHSRLAMYRMLTYIRTNAEHQPHTATLATNFSTGQTVTDTGIDMFDDANHEISFVYDNASKELRLIESGNSHVLLNGVTSFQVKLEPMRSAQSVKTGSMTYDRLMRATITFSIGTTTKTSKYSETTGTQTITISSAVMPRRNIW